MRIILIKRFARWARKEGIHQATLQEAVAEMERGLIDADLGGGVYKKRVSIAGKGKRGGTRTLVAYQLKARCFFVEGFSKSEKANINKDELVAIKEFAKELFSYSNSKIDQLIEIGEMQEI